MTLRSHANASRTGLSFFSASSLSSFVTARICIAICLCGINLDLTIANAILLASRLHLRADDRSEVSGR